MGVGMNNVVASSFERFCWSSAWTSVGSSCVESWRDRDRAVQVLALWGSAQGMLVPMRSRVLLGAASLTWKPSVKPLLLVLYLWSQVQWLWSGPERKNTSVWFWSTSRNSCSGLLEVQLTPSSGVCLGLSTELLSSGSASAASLGRWLCEEQGSGLVSGCDFCKSCCSCHC